MYLNDESISQRFYVIDELFGWYRTDVWHQYLFWTALLRAVPSSSCFAQRQSLSRTCALQPSRTTRLQESTTRTTVRSRRDWTEHSGSSNSRRRKITTRSWEWRGGWAGNEESDVGFHLVSIVAKMANSLPVDVSACVWEIEMVVDIHWSKEKKI